MKLHLLSALAATAFLASISPSLAQVFPNDVIDQQAAARAAAVERTRAIAVRRSRAPQDTEAATIGMAPAPFAAPRVAGGRPYDAMIASHAAANGVPVELVHRIVMRESRYRASARGSGGASGLMQIKLATARAMGYSGSAAGLLDPETNLTYGVRYLAGAYRAAHGSHGRAVSYYASGYRGAARPARAYAMTAVQPAPFASVTTEAAPVASMEGPVVYKHRRHHRHHHRRH